MSVCPQVHLKNQILNLPNFQYTLPVVVAWSSAGGVVIRYVLPVCRIRHFAPCLAGVGDVKMVLCSKVSHHSPGCSTDSIRPRTRRILTKSPVVDILGATSTNEKRFVSFLRMVAPLCTELPINLLLSPGGTSGWAKSDGDSNPPFLRKLRFCMKGHVAHIKYKITNTH